MTKEERKQYNKKRYQENQEKEKARRRKHYQEHKEEERAYSKKHYQGHKEEAKIYSRKWREENLEKIKVYKKKWAKENPDKIKICQKRYNTKRRATPKGRLDNSMSASIYFILKKNKASKKWESLVNYTIENLMNHLENLFDDKMNWDNYGLYWSVDHIKPISLFHYETAEDIEFKECWSLVNLQPMEVIANIKKSNHY